jgi:hypothetical protein
MLRRLFGLLSKLATFVLVFAAVTTGWVIFDGLNDVGDHADMALVVRTPGDVSASGPALERAARLYHDGAFPSIYVCSPDGTETASVEKFLEDHGVSSGAIISGAVASNEGEAVAGAAAVLKARGLHSVMVVADYYRITRIKVGLMHGGVSQIDTAHSRSAGFGDALAIGYEVAALYDYLFHTYLLPFTEKIKSEASTEAVKAQEQADKAKAAVQKKLDDLPK